MKRHWYISLEALASFFEVTFLESLNDFYRPKWPQAQGWKGHFEEPGVVKQFFGMMTFLWTFGWWCVQDNKAVTRSKRPETSTLRFLTKLRLVRGPGHDCHTFSRTLPKEYVHDFLNKNGTLLNGPLLLPFLYYLIISFHIPSCSLELWPACQHNLWPLVESGNS